MKVAITGASGLVGSALTKRLTAANHEVFPVVRNKERSLETLYWNPLTGEIEKEKFEGIDAVIHLAGESVIDRKWTDAQKRTLLESRSKGTKLIAETLAELENPPEVFVSASAIGYYGDRGDELLTEESPPGTGFLPETSIAWEEATSTASTAGIRVAQIRIGVVLAQEGGALQKMRLPFQLGLGGKIGSGQQYWSWITLNDLLRIIEFALQNPEVSGPLNGTAPNPVTNLELTKTLGKVLKRPTCLPVPAFAIRTILGERADALLLASARVIPERLTNYGFEFEQPNLEEALRTLL